MQAQITRATQPKIEHPPLVNKNLVDQVKRQFLERELNLINICHELGGIAEAGHQYTLTLTLHINQPAESLTVAQLLDFHRECVQRFNQENKS